MNRKLALGISITVSFLVLSMILSLLSSTAQAVGSADDRSLSLQSSLKADMGWKSSLRNLEADDKSDEIEPNHEMDLWVPGGTDEPDDQDFANLGAAGLSEVREKQIERLRMRHLVESRSSQWWSSLLPQQPSVRYRDSNQIPSRSFHPAATPDLADRSPQAIPESINAAYSITLQTIHMNNSGDGKSSTFVFTNTGASDGNYYLDFYWPNGDHYGQAGPYGGPMGVPQNIDLIDSPFGGGNQQFFGRIVISGDQPLTAIVTSPDYGYISGVVYEDDGVTTMPDMWISVNRDYDHQYYGDRTSLSDGSYYAGGLLDNNYIVTINPSYPWAKQWYNGQEQVQDADSVSISAGGIITGIDFTLQPGGQITGTVYADDGTTPLENVNVDLDQGWFGTCTDSNGHFVIDAVPYGDQVVVAGRGWNWCLNEQSIYMGEYYSETNIYDNATLVTVNGGDDIAENINFTMEEGGVITGRVTAAVGGAPFEDLSVWADEYYNNNFGYHTRTDPNGYYTLTGLVAADYMIQSAAPYPYAKQWYDHQEHGQQADQIAVSLGATVTGIDLELEPGGMITGYVYDAGGSNPLENINVDLAQGWYGTCTDSNGYYELQGAPYGDQVVQAGGDWNHCQNQQSAYIKEYYNETYNYDDATPVTLNSGDDIGENINFTMDTGGTITGRVTAEAGGAGLENVHVNADEYDNNDFNYNADTDASGYYTITGLVDTDYRVQVNAPAGFAGEFYNDTYNHNDADRVTISGGGTVGNVDFALAPGGIITGVVVDQSTGLPLADVQVNAHDDNQGFGSGTCTDSDGSYVVAGLPYGEYRAESGGDWNHCQDRPSEHVRQYYDHQQYYNDADMVTLNSGITVVTDINFDLEEGGYITGTVVDESQGNAPIADLRIEALISSGPCPGCSERLADTQTDSNGQYVLGPLPAAEIAVYACPSCDGILLVNEYYSDAYDLQTADLVSVTAGVTVTDIDFMLGSGILLTGTVTVPGGYSAEDIQIGVWKQDGINYNGGGRTDAGGNYIIPVPPIYDSYWSVEVRAYGTDLGFEYADGFDLAQHTQWDFDLGPGGTITGRITNGGVPVVNDLVSASSDWGGQVVGTDSDGYYEITNLHPGNYQVRGGEIFLGSMWSYYGGHDWDWATVISLEEGETVGDINFEVPELGQLEGYVYESDGTTPLEGVRISAMNSNGYWQGWSQSNGYFSVDLPAGDHKVRFGMEDWSMEPVYYPDARTHSDAVTVTVPPVDASLFITQTMEHWASLSGKITDAGTGDPIEGIHVAVQNIDRWSSDGACTDENGEYNIEQFWHGGDVIVTAVGTCGAFEYETLTTTFETAADVGYTWNVSMTAGTMPELPFTIRTPQVFDLTPLSSGGGVTVNDIDQILPALFTPIAQLNDDGEWYSELLTQIPTQDNGGVAIIGDQMVVTYTLKSGLLWSDGESLTSDDIRFAWELITWPYVFADSYYAQVGDAWHIESVLTPDPLTVVMVYEPEYRTASYMGAILYPLPEHVLNGQHPMDIIGGEYAHYPVGNGPYVVEDWVPRSHYDLRANPNYHKRGSGFPKIEEVRFLFGESHPFWSLVSGVADVSLNVGDSLPGDYDTYDVVVETSASGGFDSFIPNTELPFFQDAAVRTALNYALDRQTIVENNPFASLPADGWIPTDNPMHPGNTPPYTFSLATAESMLDTAGWVISSTDGIRYKDGVKFAFELVYNEGSEHRQIQSIMFHDDLESIGIDVTLIEMPWNDMLDAAQRGTLDAYGIGWGFDNRFDPQGYVLFHSSQIPTAYNSYRGSLHNGRWQNALNDTLLYSATQEIDEDELRNLYDQQLALFNDEMPTWPTKFYVSQDAAVPTLLNFKPGQAMPVTWNIEEWEQPDNPYDLSVRKSLALDSPAPQPDTTITYEISIRNQGYFTVTGATLLDELQDDVVFVGAVPAPDQVNGSLLTWNLGEIAGNTNYGVIELAVHIAATYTHMMTITNESEVYGDQVDTHLANNGFVHLIEVREDVDLAVNKVGVGQPAIGEDFNYYIDYANWGGAPATNVVITDTLPPEVNFKSATPAHSGKSGNTITWTLPTLVGNQWGGQIQINVEITASGKATNTASITEILNETTFDNNTDDHVEDVDDILAPVILRPTQGTVDQTPTVSGLAPSNSVVDLFDISDTPTKTWLMSDTATVSGTFSMELNLTNGTYIFAATATKDGLTSDLLSMNAMATQRRNNVFTSGSATVNVEDDLPLDPDYVTIKADGVDMSAGSVRANKYTLARRLLDVEAKLTCAVGEPSGVHLDVTENGAFYYNVPVKTISGPDINDDWDVEFQFWMGNPHSTYDVWIEWTCDTITYRENLMYILIDPDGYVYDQALVDAGSTMTDSILVNSVVTAYVRTGDDWEIWPAYVYGQVNPQVTDGTTDRSSVTILAYSPLWVAQALFSPHQI